MGNLIATFSHLKVNYWPLVKSRQTLLLTLTGVAGYLCQPQSPPDWAGFLGMIASMIITISGCTVLNMLFDRDIDRKMTRTSQRPVAAGQVKTHMALILGASLVALGLFWSAKLSVGYFLLISAGAGINILVYTLWLKRRSAWSILFGGVAGGIPILAGRTLAIGQLDLLGLLLALVILFWIPSHNLTLGMLFSQDYINAGVPTFLNVYGLPFTRTTIALSSALTVLTMVSVWIYLNASTVALVFLILISMLLAGMSLLTRIDPSQKNIMTLYKYSSLYMLFSMLLLSFNGIL